MADPVVHLTNGLPDSGTGNITTLGQTLLDGANVTIGAKTDAKAATSDATAITAMSIWKQLSFSIQAAAASLAGTLTVGTHAVTGSGNFASTVADGSNVTLGAKTDAKSTSTDGTSISIVSVLKQVSASVQALVTAIGSTAWDLGSGTSGTRTQRVIVDSSQFSTLGQAAMALSQPVAIASNQTWPTGMSPRAIAAAFTTLTRPANTTAYTAADSISDNATAGSVIALSASVSDTNDDPITLTEILVSSTDTGLAGKRIRAYLFNSDPTASSGVGAGDNVAYSQKKAGYIGAMSGVLETGFSDGTVGRLVPSFNDGAAASTPNAAAGGFIVTKPTSGAKTIFVQYQAIDGFTPSANSTTIIGTARGFQGRAS